MTELGSRKKWDDIFQVFKEKSYQPIIPYLVKIFFKNKGGIQILSDEERLKNSSPTDLPWKKKRFSKQEKKSFEKNTSRGPSRQTKENVRAKIWVNTI